MRFDTRLRMYQRMHIIMFVMFALTIAQTVVSLSSPTNSSLDAWISSGLSLAVALIGSGLLFRVGQRLMQNQRVELIRGARMAHASPIVLALGILSFSLGDLVWNIEDLIHAGEMPYPSYSDIFYVAGYPLLLLGIILVPTTRHTSLSRWRTVLDGGVYLAFAASVLWYTLIAPSIQSGGETLSAVIISGAYPIGDLGLLGCLLLLLLRNEGPQLRKAVALLSAGFATMVVADLYYNYQVLYGTYVSGSLVDVGWTLSYVLIAIGGQRLAARIEQSSRSNEHITFSADQPLWHTLLTYACLPVYCAFFLYAWQQDRDGVRFLGVAIGGASIIVLILVRQFLEIVDNTRLHRASVEHGRMMEALNDELAEANHLLERLATTDPLTELPNHRAMIAAIDQEIERASRYGRSTSILFIDIDHFKAVNDAYGHPVGDALLCEFGRVVRATLRKIDSLGRWGGEEFIAVIPETTPGDSVRIAERVRTAVAGNAFDVGGGIHLTCSIGIASYPGDGFHREQIISAADQALYAAKRLGRNQVRAAGDEAVEALTVAAGDDRSREVEALAGIAEALAWLVEARDRYTGAHGAEVSDLAMRVAVELGLDDPTTQALRMSGRLHDIGKVAVPDAILSKPGRLSEEEWAIMRLHPIVGQEVVSHIPALRSLAPLIRGHHERWDGTGYPDGLAGEDIPLGSRILSVVDAFTAMTSDRPYQAARSIPAAVAELRQMSGTQFDPAIVSAFERIIARPVNRAGVVSIMERHESDSVVEEVAALD